MNIGSMSLAIKGNDGNHVAELEQSNVFGGIVGEATSST